MKKFLLILLLIILSHDVFAASGLTNVTGITATSGSSGASGTVSSGVAPNLAYYATSGTTVSQATGLFYSSTRSGLDFLGNVTTANLISLGTNGTDITSYAIGPSALLAATSTGTNNLAIGSGALSKLTTSINNMAIGNNALSNITTGGLGRNIAIGFGAGAGISSGTAGLGAGAQNIIIGWEADVGTVTASSAVAIGNQAVAGSGTVAIGNSVDFNAAAGTMALNSVLIGNNAGNRVTGTGSTFLGFAAGAKITSGTNNTIIGSDVESTNQGVLTSGSFNLVIGNDTTTHVALSNTTSAIIIGAGALGGSTDTAIGVKALGATTTNTNANVALGYKAGSTITTGTTNLILGPNVASTTLTIGSNNILIGTTSALDTTTSSTSNTLSISGGTTAILTASAINGTPLLAIPGIASDATHTDATVCEDTTTHALYAGSGTLGVCLGTSSMRYKKDIIPLNDGLKKILELKPVNFFYKKGHGDNGQKEQYGFLAEDVYRSLPKLTQLDKDGKPNSVDILGMVPIMVKAIQEQQHQIDELTKQSKGHNHGTGK